MYINVLKLIFTNAWRRKSDSIVVLIGTSLAVASLFVLFSLREGAHQFLWPEGKNSLSEISVFGTKQGSFMRILRGESKRALDEKAIDAIKKIPSVTQVTPHVIYQNLATIELDVISERMQTDAIIYGVPESIVNGDIPLDTAWESPSGGPVPVVIARKLLDFYNLSLAPTAGIPPLNEASFKGKSITIFPGFSSFFSSGSNAEWPRMQGTIVGFSDNVDFLGITVPLKIVNELNANEGHRTDRYYKLTVQTTSVREVPGVSERIEALGFRTRSIQNQHEEIGRSLMIADVILFILGGVIVALSLMHVSATASYILLKRRSELGLMRALGASQKKCATIIAGEMLIPACISGVLGLSLGFLLMRTVNEFLPFWLLKSPPYIAFFLIGPPVLFLLCTITILVRMLRLEPRSLLKN